ncbi:MAG: hypothetical protein K6A80_03885 [Saccharofermentans sp.]|nr:hypothetical protein [Saccharofermentans sp.]
MSPMEVMLFFFISLAIAKAVKDSFEYWGRTESDRTPVRRARVTKIPVKKQTCQAAARSPIQYRRGQSA